MILLQGQALSALVLPCKIPALSEQLSNRQLDDNNSQFGCQTDTYQIATIEAQVVDENDELLAEGGPWDCEDRQGTISDVEAGDGRIVKVSAKDESGKSLVEGESDSVIVIPGQSVNAGTIILDVLVNSAPVADAGPDQTPFVDDTVTLDGSGSSDVDGDLLSYSWSFTSLPPGSDASLSDPTAVNPTFDVDVFGIYAAQLIVNDGTVNSDPDTVAINVQNSAPVLDFIGAQSVFEGDVLEFTITASDPDGDALSFTVQDLPPGATPLFDNGNNTASFTWSTESDNQDALGSPYSVTFTVSDDQSPPLSDSETVVISVSGGE